MRFPAVSLHEEQAETLAVGIAEAAARWNRPVWACAVMPNHVHLVMSRTDGAMEESVAAIKQRASWELTRTGRHPLARYRKTGERLHSPWARGFWKVYLNTPDDIERSMQYVNDNPVKDGRPPQHWNFIVKPDV